MFAVSSRREFFLQAIEFVDERARQLAYRNQLLLNFPVNFPDSRTLL